MGEFCTEAGNHSETGFVFGKITYARLQQTTVMPGSRSLLPHSHEQYEIFINLGDTIQYAAGDCLTELPYGSAICLSPSVIHYAYNDVGNTYHRARLHIDPSVMEQLVGFQPSLGECFTPPVRIAHLPGDIMEWVQNFEKVACMCREDAYLPVLPPVISLLLRIREAVPTAEDGAKPFVKVPKILNDILIYMNREENFLAVSSNREIARHFFISESYLSRLFEKYMPLTAHRYLMKLKMEYAGKMLKNGSSVTETCFTVGFSDCSHFIAVYKQYMGETPGSGCRLPPDP